MVQYDSKTHQNSGMYEQMNQTDEKVSEREKMKAQMGYKLYCTFH